MRQNRRRRATSGRSCSPATTVFFEAEALGVDERPDRPVVDVQTALGQLGDQSTQGEGTRATPDKQPVPMLARNFPRLVATHLPRCGAAGSTVAVQPPDRSAHPDPEPRSRRATRSTTLLDDSDNALPQVH
jgi:hypothetical protein